jgi:hypothetical protein
VQGYDLRGNLVSRCYEYDNASLTRCYGATYDAVGNPTSLTDPEGTDVVAVDNLDRIASVTRQVSGQPDAVESYAHNAMGALSVNAGAAMDHQRPALSGGALTDAAVPATWNGQPVVLRADGPAAPRGWTRTRFAASQGPRADLASRPIAGWTRSRPRKPTYRAAAGSSRRRTRRHRLTTPLGSTSTCASRTHLCPAATSFAARQTCPLAARATDE